VTLALKQFSLRPAIKLTLPKEHGSWSLALEPVALGLLVAPSIAGSALAIAVIAGFFLRRPLKIFMRESDYERWKIARNSIFILTVIAFAGLILAIKIGGFEKLWSLIPATLAGLAFAWFDSRNENREGAAEIFGALAFGILPATFAILAGWNFVAAISLAVVMLARSVPTVLFVRTYLRIKKGHAVTIAPAIIATIVGFLLVASLVFFKIAPWLAGGFALVMTAKVIFLLGTHPNFSTKTICIAEAIFGAVMVLALAMAWRIA
jgi:hypothetical protein